MILSSLFFVAIFYVVYFAARQAFMEYVVPCPSDPIEVTGDSRKRSANCANVDVWSRNASEPPAASSSNIASVLSAERSA